jgi:hypothetical protein
MSTGNGPISTNQKKEQTGAPFVAGSADNGLSVDVLTGRIVLGNDFTGIAGAGQLLSNREIFTNGFLVNFVDGTFSSQITAGIWGCFDSATGSGAGMQPGFMSIQNPAGDDPFVELTAGAGLIARIRLNGGEAKIETQGTAIPEFRIVMGIGNVLIGGNLVDNGNKLQVDGHVSMLSATANLDFPNTLPFTSSDLTIALAGAAVGDMAVVGFDPAALDADSCYTAFVDAPGSVTVRFNNYSAVAIDPAARDFTVSILKPL